MFDADLLTDPVADFHCDERVHTKTLKWFIKRDAVLVLDQEVGDGRSDRLSDGVGLAFLRQILGCEEILETSTSEELLVDASAELSRLY